MLVKNPKGISERASFRAAMQQAATEIAAQHSLDNPRRAQFCQELAAIFIKWGRAIELHLSNEHERLQAVSLSARQILIGLRQLRHSPVLRDIHPQHLDVTIETLDKIDVAAQEVKAAHDREHGRSRRLGRRPGFRNYPWLANLITAMREPRLKLALGSRHIERMLAGCAQVTLPDFDSRFRNSAGSPGQNPRIQSRHALSPKR